MFKVLFKLNDHEAIEYTVEAKSSVEAVRTASAKLNRYFTENILEIFVKRC